MQKLLLKGGRNSMLQTHTKVRCKSVIDGEKISMKMNEDKFPWKLRMNNEWMNRKTFNDQPFEVTQLQLTTIFYHLLD